MITRLYKPVQGCENFAMTEYKSGDVQKLFKMSSETVRQWAIEFEDYLSPTASPGSGRMRLFTVDDLQVFALIAELKENGKTFEEIHAGLKAGQRGDIPETDIDTAIEVRAAMEVRVLQQKLISVEAERDELSHQVQELREKMGRLEGELSRADVATEKSDHTIQNQEQRIGDLQQQLLELTKQIARLEVRLEIEQEKNEGK